MKTLALFSVVTLSMSTTFSFAATKWSNCPSASPKAQSIQEIFWKSDVNGGSGPSYDLPSGQTLNNAGIVCTASKVEGLNGWSRELKAGLNPAKSVSTFKVVATADELESFLHDFGTTVNQLEDLKSAVTSFLQSKATIIVGSSKKQAVIVLASVEGKNSSAVILRLDK